MKIGIMGGTFDPIHNGHLMLGKYAYKIFDLDEVWFMPNGNPPHKKLNNIESDAADRAAMVSLAINGERRFRLEDYEVRKDEVSYSYKTMEHFHNLYRDDEFYFIIGADSLFAIETWVHPERIFPTCTILAAYRDDKDTKSEMYCKIDELKKKYKARIELLNTPLFHVSSHELRERMKQGLSIEGLVPDTVEDYIMEKRLYMDE